MRRLLLLLNRISLLVIIFAMGLGWYRFWPTATQMWSLYGLFMVYLWGMLSFIMFFWLAVYYVFIRNASFHMSLVETVRNIGPKRWITLMVITVIGVPPYFYWWLYSYHIK